MNWLALFTASAWVDFVVIGISKVFPSIFKELTIWYNRFGPVASALDVLILVLGVALAKFFVPSATGITLAGLSIAIQIVHDVLFGIIITALPAGHNQLMDVFKLYVRGAPGWSILLGDAAMIGSTVFIMEWMEENLSNNWIAFAGILAVYSLLYILYTK